MKGIDGAKLLLEKRLAGIEMAARLGMAVKINSILIPSVNDGGQLVDVAREVKSLGAHIQNITPMIPLGRFKHLRAPSCGELNRTRTVCG